MSILDETVASLAFCWRIERFDGAGLGCTSHDLTLNVQGDAYSTAPGMMPAAVSRRLGLEPGSSEVSGALSSDALSEEDLELGRWDGARVSLLALDWQIPHGDAVELLGGDLGEVSIGDGGFAAELRGAASRLDVAACPATSPECRAEFGDKKCRVDLAGRTIVVHLLSAEGTELRIDRSVDERYLFGRLRYLSGANCGLGTVILGVDGDRIRVRDLARGTLQPGLRLSLREGCDKRFQTCIERFGNAANFRGEPHLPGNDLLTRYPGA